MGKRVGTVREKVWEGWPQLVTLAICFFAGGAAGLLFAAFGGSGTELRGYLSEYFHLAGRGGLDVSFLSLLWDIFRWPLIALGLGLTPVGAVGIPVLLLVRGFLISYTAASIGHLFGAEGSAVGAVIFSVTVLAAIPALFVIGCEGFRTSLLRLQGGGQGSQMRPSVVLCGFGILAVAVALQQTLVPSLLTAVCARFFT